MRSKMKVMQRGNEILLFSSNGGRGFLWLLILELAVFTAYFAGLTAEIGLTTELLVPVLPCLGLALWTFLQMKPDLRISMNVATRKAFLVRISPLVGTREIARFSVDDVEEVALRQTLDCATAGVTRNEYVVDLQLRGGERHVLTSHGPLLAYNQALAKFSRVAGIGNRIVRLPSYGAA